MHSHWSGAAVAIQDKAVVVFAATLFPFVMSFNMIHSMRTVIAYLY